MRTGSNMRLQNKMQTSWHNNLDFTRGMAALLVLSAHLRPSVLLPYGDASDPEIIKRVFYFLTAISHQAVMIFFVLSGFLITQSIQNSVRQGQWSWRTYAINRLTRLWMVLLPALLLTLFWDSLGRALAGSSYYSGELTRATEANYGLATFLQNIFFLQTSTAPAYGTNAPLWSLANEFWYYVMFPLAYLLFTKQTTWVSKLGSLLLLVLLVMVLPSGLLVFGGIWLLGYVAVLLVQQPLVQRFAAIQSI